jgi:DeoR family transcriptional regulator, fructose operon transcriptional repressor
MWDILCLRSLCCQGGVVLAEERRRRLVQVLAGAGTASTEELARELDVSTETVRRDLGLLEGQGCLRRIHGGATTDTAMRGEEPSFADRSHAATAAKRRIAELAVRHVEPGQTLIFDVGTTALAVARALPATFHGTVVTCSLVVAAELAGRPGLDVVIAAGHVRGGDLAVSSAQTVEFFGDVHADVAFLGSGAVSAEVGVSDFYLDEVATRRIMVANTRVSYVLADESKIGRVAVHRVCKVSDVTAIITGRRPEGQVVDAFHSAGGTLLWPDEPA